ncbi:MAG: 1-deoxy-D-xylulose-5-phosphate reductoisomerase [Alphaproteobacteria bacterium]|nr:1-deoxy-D-xylulose-5-phosphate reductoisomerase [Alphaproteobacteria bacterium]
MTRKITILGSTGSIGTSTVDVISRNKELYDVQAITANSNVKLLAEQAKLLKPSFVATADETKYEDLRNAVIAEFGSHDAVRSAGIEIAAGKQAILDAASLPSDWTMSSIVGAAGLEPTLKAVRQGNTVALANKETLVCAGDLVMKEVAQYGATLLPVDSEHSAIFQVFDFKQTDKVDKIILTASGGPFRTMAKADMEKVTPEQAVAHPNWSMGAKISVDSASMMNKGLELIEAYYLFGLPENQIDILVHPQSVIHSMVAYSDGSVLAQLGTPDMRTPIAYALAWPNRMDAPPKKLDLAEIAALTFEKPDEDRFPALRIARDALVNGGSYAAVMNAANEVAVGSFLAKEIGFIDIVKVVEETLHRLENKDLKTLEDVLAIDSKARQTARDIISIYR